MPGFALVITDRLASGKIEICGTDGGNIVAGGGSSPFPSKFAVACQVIISRVDCLSNQSGKNGLKNFSGAGNGAYLAGIAAYLLEGWAFIVKTWSLRGPNRLILGCGGCISMSFDPIHNGALLEDIERRWRTDPASLDETWRSFFHGFDLGAQERDRAHTEAQIGVLRLVFAHRDLGRYCTYKPAGSLST